MHSISVIIPCYNCESTIANCLDTISPDCEIILINDCSTDKTEEVITDYIQHSNKKIKYYCNETNLGAGGTRNRAFDFVTGEYLLFVDSDDSLCNGTIAELEKIIEDHEFDCVVFDVFICYKNKKKYLRSFYTKSISEGVTEKKNALVYVRGGVCGKLFKTSVIKEFGIQFGNTKIAEDLVFVKNALIKSNSIFYMKKALYNYNQVDTSLMHTVRYNAETEDLESRAFCKIAEFAQGKYAEELNSIYFLEVLYATLSRMIKNRIGWKECRARKKELIVGYKTPDKYFRKYFLKYRLAYRFLKVFL